jgi:hypothetical protein
LPLCESDICFCWLFHHAEVEPACSM